MLGLVCHDCWNTKQYFHKCWGFYFRAIQDMNLNTRWRVKRSVTKGTQKNVLNVRVDNYMCKIFLKLEYPCLTKPRQILEIKLIWSPAQQKPEKVARLFFSFNGLKFPPTHSLILTITTWCKLTYPDSCKEERHCSTLRPQYRSSQSCRIVRTSSHTWLSPSVLD